MRLVDELLFCCTHASTPVDMYCKQCKEIICYHCLTENHKIHEVISGSKALVDTVCQAEEKIEKLTETISDTHLKGQNIRHQIEQTKKAFSQCREELDKLADRRIAEIREEQRKLHDNLTEKEEKQVCKTFSQYNTMHVQMQNLIIMVYSVFGCVNL